MPRELLAIGERNALLQEIRDRGRPKRVASELRGRKPSLFEPALDHFERVILRDRVPGQDERLPPHGLKEWGGGWSRREPCRLEVGLKQLSEVLSHGNFAVFPAFFFEVEVPALAATLVEVAEGEL